MMRQKHAAMRGALVGLAAGFSLLMPATAQADTDDSSNSTQWRIAPDGSKYPVSGWKSCAEARANTVVPVLRSDPGYNPELDPKGTGHECA